MIGAVIGDIAGSPYEGDRLVQDKRDYRPFFLNGLAKFTDDTNLTIAVADAILSEAPFKDKYLEWYTKHPNLGYGSAFKEWAEKGGITQGTSWGNGAAMRVSPIVLFANRLATQAVQGDWIEDNFDEKLSWALKMAVESTVPTHDCPEARNGAMSVVVAMMLASKEKPSKVEIKTIVEDMSKYDLSASVEEVRNTWDKRNCSCMTTVPQALICFLESTSFEDCIRLSVYSKGDVDTIAAMAGGIAEWYYGVDSINPGILVETKMRLSPEMIAIVDKCYDGQLKW